MLTVNFNVFYSSNLTTVANQVVVVRVLILQSRINFATLPVSSDIFDLTGGSNTYMSTVTGTKWRVMYDKMRALTPQRSTGAIGQVGSNLGLFVGKLHFKVKNNVNFASGTGLPGDPKDMYYLVVTNQYINGGATIGDILGHWVCRLSFIDI